MSDLSLCVRKRISLRFDDQLGDYLNKQEKDQHHEWSNSTIDLGHQDCCHVWEEAKRTDKISQLSESFTKTTDKLQWRLKNNMLTEKEKFTIVSFLRESGSIQMKVTSNVLMENRIHKTTGSRNVLGVGAGHAGKENNSEESIDDGIMNDGVSTFVSSRMQQCQKPSSNQSSYSMEQGLKQLSNQNNSNNDPNQRPSSNESICSTEQDQRLSSNQSICTTDSGPAQKSPSHQSIISTGPGQRLSSNQSICSTELGEGVSSNQNGCISTDLEPDDKERPQQGTYSSQEDNSTQYDESSKNTSEIVIKMEAEDNIIYTATVEPNESEVDFVESVSFPSGDTKTVPPVLHHNNASDYFVNNGSENKSNSFSDETTDYFGTSESQSNRFSDTGTKMKIVDIRTVANSNTNISNEVTQPNETDYTANTQQQEVGDNQSYDSRKINVSYAVKLRRLTKLFICDICGKGFSQKSSLTQHNMIHTGEKPYPCSTCGKHFRHSNNLIRHIRIHTGERPYQCGICGKRFNQTNILRIHQKRHLKERGRCEIGKIRQNVADEGRCTIRNILQNDAERRRCTIGDEQQSITEVRQSMQDIQQLRKNTTQFSSNIELSAEEIQQPIRNVLSDSGIENDQQLMWKTQQPAYKIFQSNDKSREITKHTQEMDDGNNRQSTWKLRHQGESVWQKQQQRREIQQLRGEAQQQQALQMQQHSRQMQQTATILQQQRGEMQQTADKMQTTVVQQQTEEMQLPIGEVQQSVAKLQQQTRLLQQTGNGMQQQTPVFRQQRGKAQLHGGELMQPTDETFIETVHQRDEIQLPTENASLLTPVTELYECQKCNEMFVNKNQYDDHMTRHVDHMTLHVDVRPFQCSYCSMSFRQRSTLRGHLLIHTGEEPFQCHYCNKKFRHKNNLTRHIRIHTGERPYQCKVCGKRFNQSNVLHIHEKRHHKEREGGMIRRNAEIRQLKEGHFTKVTEDAQMRQGGEGESETIHENAEMKHHRLGELGMVTGNTEMGHQTDGELGMITENAEIRHHKQGTVMENTKMGLQRVGDLDMIPEKTQSRNQGRLVGIQHSEVQVIPRDMKCTKISERQDTFEGMQHFESIGTSMKTRNKGHFEEIPQYEVQDIQQNSANVENSEISGQIVHQEQETRVRLAYSSETQNTEMDHAENNEMSGQIEHTDQETRVRLAYSGETRTTEMDHAENNEMSGQIEHTDQETRVRLAYSGETRTTEMDQSLVLNTSEINNTDEDVIYVHRNIDVTSQQYQQRFVYNIDQTTNSKQKTLKRYSCNLCPKRFNSKSCLTYHSRVHSGEKPYKCTQCEAAFATRGNLVRHKRVHTGEKPYTCNICHRSFNQSSILKRHQRVHSQ